MQNNHALPTTLHSSETRLDSPSQQRFDQILPLQSYQPSSSDIARSLNSTTRESGGETLQTPVLSSLFPLLSQLSTKYKQIQAYTHIHKTSLPYLHSEYTQSIPSAYRNPIWGEGRSQQTSPSPLPLSRSNSTLAGLGSVKLPAERATQGELAEEAETFENKALCADDKGGRRAMGLLLSLALSLTMATK